VTVRYDNLLDTVTWTWEGITAVWVIVYSLSQLYINCTIEFLPPYTPNKEEIEDPKLFASNVRKVMADSLEVGTTDCNYFDYLKMEKCKKMLKKLQKLQRRLDVPLLELTAQINGVETASEQLLNQMSEEEDLKIIEELCGGREDLRQLRLVTLIATDEDALESFLNHSCQMYDQDLGPDRISSESMENILQSLLFLTVKEAKELTDSVSDEDKIVKREDLKEYLIHKKPNFSKVVKCWEEGLSASLDLLAMSASITKQVNKRMEKVAETGTNFLCAGKEVVSDVSASITSSKDKMTGALSSAVTSLHKRTGSRCETEKKTD